MARASTLRFYGWLFLVCGILFVARECEVLGLVSWAGRALDCAPLTPSGPSLWLGLSGSLMAMIALLAFRLAEDPRQPAAWDTLLLSKAVSSALFLLFAARARNPLFAASAAVDGAILVHLLILRARWEAEGLGLASREASIAKPFYEVWFARVVDERSRRAVWTRSTLTGRPGGVEASCGAVFFDPASGRVVDRWWKTDVSAAQAAAAPGVLRGAGSGISWDLRWEAGPCPAVAVVPPWLRALGASSSGYDSAAPAARFTGSAVLDGERWDFSGAPGCVGHVWGRRYGAGWWWAHAIFVEDGKETAFELLSAPGPLGLRATSAFLWRAGRLYEASGPLRLLLNRSGRSGDLWTFAARFGGGVSVEGECSPGPAATLEYLGPDGKSLICRNSKVSPMRLRVTDRRGGAALSTETAAVEYVEPPR